MLCRTVEVLMHIDDAQRRLENNSHYKEMEIVINQISLK